MKIELNEKEKSLLKKHWMWIVIFLLVWALSGSFVAGALTAVILGAVFAHQGTRGLERR